MRKQSIWFFYKVVLTHQFHLLIYSDFVLYLLFYEWYEEFVEVESEKRKFSQIDDFRGVSVVRLRKAVEILTCFTVLLHILILTVKLSNQSIDNLLIRAEWWCQSESFSNSQGLGTLCRNFKPGTKLFRTRQGFGPHQSC